MSEYRRVNYYELCRLCTSSEGNKMDIFRDEGRKRQLQTKIQICLPIQVLEEDSLPKIVCHECVRKLENFIEFRETVVSAEGMLESYFTSLRFSEDFLKEGKVYVKTTVEKESAVTPECDPAKQEKPTVSSHNQILNNEQQIQHQQPVVVSNINASNIQIISGVQARVQQYKCAMQMQAGGMAAAVVEATAETHYSYQQQTSQPALANGTQNQNNEQNQPPQIQQQVQNAHSEISAQSQVQRQPAQQLNQTTQILQQTQLQVPQQSQQQQQQNQSQQIQQLNRRDFDKHRQFQQLEKQQIHVVQEFPLKGDTQTRIVHQANNIILKNETTVNDQNHQIIQKVQTESLKSESSTQNVESYTTVQAPEVFLSVGFKEDSMANQVVREELKEFKEYTKSPSEDGLSRNSIGQISEFLRIRPGTEQTSLITINPQVISQSTKNIVCRDCGKAFTSISLLAEHSCIVQNFVSETHEIKEENSLQNNGNPFSCDICGKPFKRKEHLFQHRKLHTGERPYVCTTCSKAFSRKEHLVRHSVSHTGQKMHECEMCGKSFSRKDNLHKHRKTHGVSGPYICETCGKSFVVKHYYLMHLTTHASTNSSEINCQDPLPYKCDICHKAFSVKQYLTTHKLRHKSKNNNSSGQNTLSTSQQQSGTNNSGNTVINSASSPGNLNASSNTQSNGTMADNQSELDRNEQNDGSFANSQYQNNLQEFQ
ncbi:zinc finger protein 853-like [Prorops nasuta]|uniref:zinc finger protein 853-like n=1 Tax=Prorops nasuta TaxID=863751 RepID=UPI0034D01513